MPDLPEWDKKDKLAYERDMLGLYVSDHPLMGLEGLLGKLADKEISELHENDELPDGAMVSIAGLITSLTRKTTKQGNLWAIAQIEDLAGSIEVLFFPQTYQTVSTMLAPDTMVTVRGRLNRRDGQVALYAQEMTIPDISSAAHEAVLITLPTNRCTGPLVEQFKDVLTKHPGGSTVRLTLTSPGARGTHPVGRLTAGGGLAGLLLRYQGAAGTGLPAPVPARGDAQSVAQAARSQQRLDIGVEGRRGLHPQ